MERRLTIGIEDVLDALRRARISPRAVAGLEFEVEEAREDYVFWRSSTGSRAFLVAPLGRHIEAVELRPPQRSATNHRVGMCNVCLTVHPVGGVGLWTNRLRRRGTRVVGDWVCRGFECRDRRGSGDCDAPRECNRA